MGKASVAQNRRSIVVLTSLFLFAYVGCEVTAGGYLYTYTYSTGIGNHANAVAVNACFWLFLAIGRALAIYTSTRFSPEKILSANTGLALVSICIMLIALRSLTVLYVSMCLYGLALASSFPTAFTLVEGYIGVDPTSATIFVIGAATGEMIVPLVTAVLIDRVGLFSVPWILTSGNLAMAGIFYWLVLAGRGSALGTGKQGDSHHQEEEKRKFKISASASTNAGVPTARMPLAETKSARPADAVSGRLRTSRPNDSSDEDCVVGQESYAPLTLSGAQPVDVGVTV